jgi:hypothetical protein
MAEIPLAPAYVIKPDGTKYRIAGDAGPEGPEGPEGQPGTSSGQVILADSTTDGVPGSSHELYPFQPGQLWIDTGKTPADTQVIFISWPSLTSTGSSYVKPASANKAVITYPCPGVVTMTGQAWFYGDTVADIGVAIGSNVDGGADTVLSYSGHAVYMGTVNKRSVSPVNHCLNLTSAAPELKLWPAYSVTAGTMTVPHFRLTVMFHPYAKFLTTSV